MSVRTQLALKVAKKARPITAIISLISLYYLSVLANIGDRVNVSEDTMSTGGTPAFVNTKDLTSVRLGSGATAAIESVGLPRWAFTVSTGETITYTVVESKRGDTREAVVCAIMENSHGLAIGLGVAQAMTRAQWLARDVYFVFVPETVGTFAYGLREWLDDFYFNPKTKESLTREKPLIRAAFALDLGVDGPLFLEYEGINGILADQDISNLAFEVADELKVPLKLRPLYDSVALMAFNGGVHSPHTAFLDSAIPAITLRREAGPSTGSSALQIAQVVGKYLRALSSLHHQLHHSTSVFFYSAYRQDVSLGKIVPLMVGLMSPWFVCVLDSEVNNVPAVWQLGLLGWVLSAYLILGGLIVLVVINSVGVGAGTGAYCKSLVNPEWTIGKDEYLFIASLTAIHVLISGKLSEKVKFDFGSEMKTTIFRASSIVMTMLIVFHWGASALVVIFLLPTLLVVTPLRGNAKPVKKLISVSLFSTSLYVFYLMVTGQALHPVIAKIVSEGLDSVIQMLKTQTGLGHMPMAFVGFFKDIASGTKSLNKSTATLVQELFCVKGLAISVMWMIIFPSLVVALEIMLAKSDAPMKPGVKTDVSKIKKVTALAVAGLAFFAYEYMKE